MNVAYILQNRRRSARLSFHTTTQSKRIHHCHAMRPLTEKKWCGWLFPYIAAAKMILMPLSGDWRDRDAYYSVTALMVTEKGIITGNDGQVWLENLRSRPRIFTAQTQQQSTLPTQPNPSASRAGTFLHIPATPISICSASRSVA